METKNINAPDSTGKKQEKKNMGKQVGAMAGAAAVGAVGAVGVQEVLAAESITLEQSEPVNPVSVNPGPVNPAPEPVDPNNVVIDPEPVSPAPVGQEPVTPTPENHATNPVSDPVPEPAPIQDVDVNPDEIADAIIAEEQIDPNDIDAGEVINFDDVGMVYTVTGESYNAALFHDEYGNEMMMVDVDGDELFDIITTTDGEHLVAEVDGQLSVSDAELMISNDPGGYLTPSLADNTSLPEGEDIMNDILEG